MRLILLLILVVTSGCFAGHEVPLQAGEGDLAETLRVTLGRSPDRLGAGVAWSVTVTNVGETQVDDLVLVLDEAWSAPIQRLRLDRAGSDSGVEHPAGLTAGETLVVRSSHDITNHHLLRNAADEPYPPDRVPRVVGLESAGSRGTWAVR